MHRPLGLYEMRYLGSLIILSVAAISALPSFAEPIGTKERKGVAVTAYGGQMTDNDWLDPFAREAVDFRGSSLLALAGAKELKTFFDYFAIELEGQAVRHWGEQNHWEFNVPLVFRWQKLPWDSVVDTSIAYGIGPSYATATPSEEVARAGDSEQWLVYWMVEIEFALPAVQDWSAVARLHHRSGAWGLVADDGSSNVLAIGIKRRF